MSTLTAFQLLQCWCVECLQPYYRCPSVCPVMEAELSWDIQFTINYKFFTQHSSISACSSLAVVVVCGVLCDTSQKSYCWFSKENKRWREKNIKPDNCYFVLCVLLRILQAVKLFNKHPVFVNVHSNSFPAPVVLVCSSVCSPITDVPLFVQ